MARPRVMTSDEYRTRIIGATLAVVAENGPAGAKLADIAERAGISYGMLYQHFPNRNELLLEAIRHQTKIVEREWNKAASEPDPILRLIAIALTLIRCSGQITGGGRDLLFALQGAPPALEGAAAEAARMSQLGLRKLRAAVREARRQGYFADLDEDVVSVAILAIPEAYVVSGHVFRVRSWGVVEREIAKIIRRLAGEPVNPV